MGNLNLTESELAKQMLDGQFQSLLGGFRIEFSQMLEANKHLSERSSLVAVRKDGRALHLLRAYPDQIVNQLADQLPLKIEEITGLKPASERSGADSLG